METVQSSPALESFLLHAEHSARIDATPVALFEHLDDPRRLGAHMEKPSWRTLGSSMHYTFDAGQGRALGSEIRMDGRLLGMRLSLTETVTARIVPRYKAWATTGVPRLLVVGRYRMGFEVWPGDVGSRLRVFIDYELGPLRPRWLCRPLAAWYARWCVRSMAEDARRHFGG